MDASWLAPETPWMAKLRRAHVHIREVQERVETIEFERPWTVESRAGNASNKVEYRLVVTSEPPADLLTAVGDAVHNLRSSLDTIAYELARRSAGEPLTEDQERVSAFPICVDRASFDAFFNDRRRRGMFGDLERAALAAVQPFAFAEQAMSLGVEAHESPDEALRTDPLYRLTRLSNIDKHRRLPVLAWVPKMSYWTSGPDSPHYGWEPADRAADHSTDGLLLGTLINETSDVPPEVDMRHEVRILLMDDPAYRLPVIDALRGWHHRIANWVLPTIAAVMNGAMPPTMITYSGAGQESDQL